MGQWDGWSLLFLLQLSLISLSLTFGTWYHGWNMQFMATVLPSSCSRWCWTFLQKIPIELFHFQTLIVQHLECKGGKSIHYLYSYLFFHVCLSAGIPPVFGFSLCREDTVEVLWICQLISDNQLKGLSPTGTSGSQCWVMLDIWNM